MSELINKNLALRCVAALSLIAALASVGFVMQYDGLQKFRASQKILDLASNQKAAVHATAFLAKAIKNAPENSPRELTLRQVLGETLNEFEADLNELREAFDHSGYESTYISHVLPIGSAELESLKSKLTRFLEAARRLVVSEAGVPIDSPDAIFLTEVALSNLDTMLDTLVGKSRLDSKLRLAQSHQLNSLVLLAILISLLMVGFFIFKPMVRAVSAHHGRLLETNDFLETRAKELSKSRENLRRKTQILRSILDTMGDAVIVVDEAGHVISQNRSADRVFGPIRLGASLLEWHTQAGLRDKEYHDQLVALERSPASDAMRGGRFNDIVYYVRSSQTQQDTYVSATGRPMVDEATGQIAGAVVSFRDVTERFKQAQALVTAKQEAEIANRAKSEFLANISHEIRTPMSAILGYADCLLDAEQSQEQQLRNIQIIRRNCRTLLGLIDDLLDLSKIEAGKLKIEQTKVDLSHLMSEVYSLLHSRAQEKGIQLRLEFDGKVPLQIVTDATRLRQILINIVGNAIKFTEHGQVNVTLSLSSSESDSDQKNKLRIQVSDSGCGIRPENIKHLFSVFSQADSSTTRRFGGSGLGLAISRRLASMLGGELSLVSSKMGQGSTFAITIDPGKIDQNELVNGFTLKRANELNESEATMMRAGLEGLSVLLVEDSPENRELFTYFLKTAGANVTEAVDGLEAVEVASKKVFDVMLLDIQLPGLDGYQVTERLRKGGYQGIIIALTAHALTSEQERCRVSGFDGHISKPVTSQGLVEKVRAYAAEAGVMPQGKEGSNQDAGEVQAPGVGGNVIDLNYINSLPENIRHVINKFVSNLPARIEAIEQACKEDDWQTLGQLAHQLKGTAASCGLPGLTEVADNIEVNANSHTIKSDALAQIRSLNEMNSKVKQVFQNLNLG